MSIESKIRTTRDIYTAFVVDLDMVEESLNGKELWIPLEDHQKLDKSYNITIERLTTGIRELEAQLKRANMKLDTIDNIAIHLVKMTNLATNHKIQIDNANKILNNPPITELWRREKDITEYPTLLKKFIKLDEFESWRKSLYEALKE